MRWWQLTWSTKVREAEDDVSTMCGIFGHINPSGVSAQDLHRMTTAHGNRRPDGHGICYGTCIGFGLRRLSIIGLCGDRQPISNEDGPRWVLINSKIHNFNRYLDIFDSAISLRRGGATAS
jgi:asparagine synthetase B (glutamine-hydrolysing)